MIDIFERSATSIVCSCGLAVYFSGENQSISKDHAVGCVEIPPSAFDNRAGRTNTASEWSLEETKNLLELYYTKTAEMLAGCALLAETGARIDTRNYFPSYN